MTIAFVPELEIAAGTMSSGFSQTSVPAALYRQQGVGAVLVRRRGRRSGDPRSS
ncbi:MAG: hypothetical protein U0470_02485 [Anaerolineae bacterium]